MANIASAKKRHRQNVKRRARNRWRTRTMTAALKEFEVKVAAGTPDEALVAFRNCCRIIDRTAQKGVIHKNQAARRKSRLSARLRAKAA